MDLQQQFEQAVADSKSLTERPSNDTLHQLPALIQRVTREEYNEAVERMKPVANAISEGAHLRAALVSSPVSSQG